MKKLLAARLCLSASIGTLASSGAYAQHSALDEIIVTAQKRVESLQDVPVSVSAFSGDALARHQIRGHEDLAANVPNMHTNAAVGEGSPIFSLRGISMSDFSLAQNGPVAVYADQVFRGNFALMGIAFFDLARVEVLKGPQGTLYGKNTTGGAINLVSQVPEFFNEAYFSAGISNYNHRQVEGAGQVALSDTIAARVAFTYEQADGWQKNKAPGAPDASSTDHYGVRASIRYQPSDTFDFILRASASSQQPWNYGVASIPGPSGAGGTLYPIGDFRKGLDRHEINTPDIYRRRARQKSISATADWRFHDSLTLTSITAWDEGTLLNIEDGDGTPLRAGYAEYFGRTKQFSQDFRLTSDLNHPLNFILGAYYSVEKIYNYTDLRFGSDIDVNGDGVLDYTDCMEYYFPACEFGNEFDQEKTSFALYADFNYELTDRLTLRTGIRYTKDEGDLKNFKAQYRDVHGVPFYNAIPGNAVDLNATTKRSFDDDEFSGKLGIDYAISDDIMVYASYSRGYRGSAFSGQAFFAPEELTVADPETVDAFEVGFKSELFGRSLRANGAVFWYGYKDQQYIDLDPDTTVSTLRNLPKAEILGAELELQWLATQDLILSTSIGLLDTEAKKGTVEGVDVSGNRLINSPEFSLSAAVDWTKAVPWSDWIVDTHIDVSHTSSHYFDILNRSTTKESGYELVNLKVRVHPADDRYGISFWMKNATNTNYYTNKIDALSGLGIIYTHVGKPRTYGLTFDIQF